MICQETQAEAWYDSLRTRFCAVCYNTLSSNQIHMLFLSNYHNKQGQPIHLNDALAALCNDCLKRYVWSWCIDHQWVINLRDGDDHCPACRKEKRS
jgi:hypothetical protein